jgi:hypothetical protein
MDHFPPRIPPRFLAPNSLLPRPMLDDRALGWCLFGVACLPADASAEMHLGFAEARRHYVSLVSAADEIVQVRS